MLLAFVPKAAVAATCVDAMLDTEHRLQDLAKELSETRGGVIKTLNTVQGLQSDLRNIAKRQATYERTARLSSAAAYASFCVVLFGSLKIAWDARVAESLSASESRTQELGRLRDEMKEMRVREADRQVSEARVADVMQKVAAGRRQEAIDELATMGSTTTGKGTALALSLYGARMRAELSEEKYVEGLAKHKLERFQEAAGLLEGAFALASEGKVSGDIRLALAKSYRKLNRTAESIPILLQVAEFKANVEAQDDALYELAWCYAELKDWNNGKQAWRDLIRKFPGSHYAAEGKMYLAQWEMIH